MINEDQMRSGFEQVLKELKDGVPLNLAQIGNIFGQEFWILVVLCMGVIEVKSEGKVEITINTGKQ